MVTLDNLIHELNHVDLIKLDIQGGEPSALKGAENIIYKNKPILLVEAVQGWESTELTKELLNHYNYSIKGVDRRGQLCELKSNKTFVSWDWIAIPQKKNIHYD